MIPIKGWSDHLRMPRLGKIPLGVKKLTAKGVEYPTATDYFVCPDEVKKVHGDKPRRLPIMIPTEDEEYWASQYYRAYSQTRGLTCKGNGEKARRMIDTQTHNIPGKNTIGVAWEEINCQGRECDTYKSKKCSEVMCLQFMLPDVPGVGVWQVDTGSINSIKNINSEAALIKGLCGHISMLPLLLTLEPEPRPNPETGKMQTHYFLHLRERDTLQKLLSDSQKPVFELLAPPVDEAQAARDIEELWPEDEQTKSQPPVLEPPPFVPDKSQPVASEEESSSEIPADASPIDMVWLKENLPKAKWTEKTAISWLKSKANFTGLDFSGTFYDIVSRMNKEQADFLYKEIQGRAELA